MAAVTDHAKAGWDLGISASDVPCPSLCSPDLVKLAETEQKAKAVFEAELARYNAICNVPRRDGISLDEDERSFKERLRVEETYRDATREYNRAKRAVWNYVENHLRDLQGLPHVGEGWLNETKLFRIVQQIFPDDEVIHHYRAKWLGRLELDVYVVGADIGIEYQGIQHYEPQDHWGGLEGFERTIARDEEKVRRCATHGTRLVEFTCYEDLSVSLVRERLFLVSNKS